MFNMKEELKKYKDFMVNDISFDDYYEAKKYKQELLDADIEVIFSGYDKTIKKRVNFYIYVKSPPFERRPLNVEIELCKRYYNLWN